MQVLLVCEYKERDVLKIFLSEQALELLSALLQTNFIRGIDDVHETVCILIIVLPVGANCLLTTDVPHVKLEAVLSL